jgi:hypothetical protein
MSSIIEVCSPLRDNEAYELLVEGAVGCIHELEQDRVLPGRKKVDDERLAAGIDPAPGAFIDSDVNVPKAGRHCESRLPEHGHYPNVLDAILNHHSSVGEVGSKWLVRVQTCRWLGLERDNRRCWRTARAGPKTVGLGGVIDPS